MSDYRPSSEPDRFRHEAGNRVNKTGKPELVNGIFLIPDKPRNDYAGKYGCLVLIVIVVVIALRILTM